MATDKEKAKVLAEYGAQGAISECPKCGTAQWDNGPKYDASVNALVFDCGRCGAPVVETACKS